MTIICLIHVFSIIAHAEPAVPQWSSFYIGSSEGGAGEVYTKGSLLSYERNTGKFFYSGEYKKIIGENISNDTFGVTMGIQPDWALPAEPRLSVGMGIGRGQIDGDSSRSSYLACRGELLIRANAFFALSVGSGLTSLQAASKKSGIYQETFFGLRLFFY